MFETTYHLLIKRKVTLAVPLGFNLHLRIYSIKCTKDSHRPGSTMLSNDPVLLWKICILQEGRNEKVYASLRVQFPYARSTLAHYIQA